MANEQHNMDPDRRAALVHDLAVAGDSVHDADEPHADAASGEHEIAREPGVIGSRDEPDRIMPDGDSTGTGRDDEGPPVWHDGPREHGAHR